MLIFHDIGMDDDFFSDCYVYTSEWHLSELSDCLEDILTFGKTYNFRERTFVMLF